MATGPVTDGTRVTKSEHGFEWAFALGFVVIFATKLVARGQPILGGIVASGIGVVIMVIYVVQQRRERPEGEHSRLGDEVYYLGLLYTLTSLCAALVSLFLLDGDERSLDERTNEMVGSFGIALLTDDDGRDRHAYAAPTPRDRWTGNDHPYSTPFGQRFWWQEYGSRRQERGDRRHYHRSGALRL